jgi:hypothetical protein
VGTVDAARFQYFRAGLMFDGERERSQTLRTSQHHERYAVVVFAVSWNPDWGRLLVMSDWPTPYCLRDDFQQFACILSALSIRITKPQSRKPKRNQASAGSKPVSVPILVATSTSNRVAVLRTLPEIVMSASETTGCTPASVSRRSLTLWSC